MFPTLFPTVLFFFKRPHQNRIQLEEPRDQRRSDMLARSALGLVWVYNHLPPKVVEHPSVSSFQAELRHLVKDRATARCAD